MDLIRFRKRKVGDKINPILDQNIFGFLEEAEESLREGYPEEGVKLFRTADSLYCLRGYDSKVDRWISGTFNLYLDECPEVL